MADASHSFVSSTSEASIASEPLEGASHSAIDLEYMATKETPTGDIQTGVSHLLSDKDSEMIEEEGNVQVVLEPEITDPNPSTSSFENATPTVEVSGSNINHMDTTPHLGETSSLATSIPTSENQIPSGLQSSNSPPTDTPTLTSNADMAQCNFMEGDVAEVTEDEEDDSEDDDEDEDMASEVSDGVDLQEELQDALDDSNFSFHGSFYHGSLLANPPNPCLFISGLGLVGLPLSERDAKAIIGCSTLAPFGHGEHTVIDKDVRDTWEIEPARIAFGNTIWQDYVNKTLCSELCKSLGVPIGANQPKMELYKLLLYETGSHFLPHQDTQKADGMFATAIILLPSAYTGGQVIVSHASNTKTIDFAKDSLLSTALLAWYTDVKHEVKPVTSGYRLALSYNLIHVAPAGVPPPCLPDMRNSMHLLRHVLKKWRRDKYEEESQRNFVVYLLNHEYSAANLSEGLKALKGVDLHRISFIRPIAEELGFRVGLAYLEHNISGAADDDGHDYYRRDRYDDYHDEESDEETPEMMEVSSTTTTISGLMDLNGFSMLSVGKIEVEADCLIPKEPFEDETPDDTDYEGYMGNGAGQLDYWYRRTALVLMHEDRVDDVCYSADGAPYAFRMLKKSTTIPPTPDDRRWADRLLKGGRSFTKEHALTLLDYALKWKDLAMWKTTINNPTCSLAVIDSKILSNAMEIFTFEGVRLSFETLLARSTILSERVNFLSKLLSKVSASEKDAVNAWYRREVTKILSSYTSANVQDIPTILYIIHCFGLTIFQKIVMPNLTKKKDNYAFCIAFMKALYDKRQTILERESSRVASMFTNATPEAEAPSPPAPTAEVAVNNLIKECLQAAVTQWSVVAVQNTYYSYNRPMVINTPKIDRIIEIIEQSMVISDLDICKTLFVGILKSPGTTATKFQDIYTPLIPRLRGLLTAKGQNLSQPPFVDFIQLIIGLYLRDVLGKKGQLSSKHLRKIGCGCADCKMLDDFILDPTRTTTLIRIVQARRLHLERQAAAARDLCTYQTIRSGSPHGIQLTKLPAVVEASTWISRQKAAKTFLASIGSDIDISRIMGNRHTDVKHAVDGLRHFGSVPTNLPSTSTSRAPLTTAIAPTATRTLPSTTAITMAHNFSQNLVLNQNLRAANVPQVASSSIGVTRNVVATAVPPQIAGKKRKTEPKVNLGTIDLTGEDSS